jgi:hypothetical protein
MVLRTTISPKLVTLKFVGHVVALSLQQDRSCYYCLLLIQHKLGFRLIYFYSIYHFSELRDPIKYHPLFCR